MAINKIIYGGNTLIDLTGDTVTAADLKAGVKAHDNSGVQITGTNTYDADTSDATAKVAEILATKTAYVNGSKLTGTMPNRGAVIGSISAVNEEYTIQQGYHDGSGKVTIDEIESEKLIPGNIKTGIEILGITGTYGGEEISVQTKTVIPTITSQTITPDAEYDYLSQVTVGAIPYTETANAYGTTVTIG